MFVFLFLLSVASDLCESQMVYSRLVPYDPRYLMHRPPVRRSAMEALERLRLPVSRYVPQDSQVFDSQVAFTPKQHPVTSFPRYERFGSKIYIFQPGWAVDDLVTPVEVIDMQEPPYSSDDAYVAPRRQWTDDFIAPDGADDDYGNYEYENSFAPVYRPAAYADEIYVPQEPVVQPEPSDNAYNDFMVNYLLENSDPVAVQPEEFDLQRRSDSSFSANNGRQGMIQLSNVIEANKNVSNLQKTDTTQAPPAPASSQVPPQVQMTAVPAAPEKKELKSLVIPAPIVETRDESEDPWRTLGQKEEPLFRPLQNSQKTTWEVLTRAKNSVAKRPIPLLKKMIQNSQPKNTDDPLTEELKNLKKEHA